MTEDYEERLKRMFEDSHVELTRSEFTASLMDRVRRYQRRRAISCGVVGLGLLVLALIVVPYLQGSALSVLVLPGEATLSMTSGSVAQSPLLFMLGLAIAGFFLLDSWSS